MAFKVVGTSGAQLTIRGYTGDENFTMSLVPRDKIVTPGSTSSVTDRDINLTRQSSAIIDREFDVVIADSLKEWIPKAAVVTSTPDIVRLSGKSATRLTDGTATIIAFRPGGDRITATFAVSRSVAISDVFSSFVTGSLAKHIFDATAAIVGSNARDGGKNEMWFTSANPATLTFTRNPNHLLSGFDLSGISVASRTGAGNTWENIHRTATMVSPRHFLTATHWPASNANAFLGSDNAVYTRSVVSLTNIAGTDVSVGELDSDLPPAVRWYKVLPSTARLKLPSADYKSMLPILEQKWNPSYLFANQVFSTSMVSSVRNGATDFDITSHASPIFSKWTDPLNNSSSNPGFFPINNELVLVGTQHTSISNSNLIDFFTQINSSMAGYQLTAVDLTGFNSY